MKKILEFKKPAETDEKFISTVQIFHIMGCYMLEVTDETISLIEFVPLERMTHGVANDIRKKLGLKDSDEINIKHLYLADYYKCINTTRI